MVDIIGRRDSSDSQSSDRAAHSGLPSSHHQHSAPISTAAPAPLLPSSAHPSTSKHQQTYSQHQQTSQARSRSPNSIFTFFASLHTYDSDDQAERAGQEEKMSFLDETSARYRDASETRLRLLLWWTRMRAASWGRRVRYGFIPALIVFLLVGGFGRISASIYTQNLARDDIASLSISPHPPTSPSNPQGHVVILLNDLFELELASKLVCGFARTQFLHLIVHNSDRTRYQSSSVDGCTLDIIRLRSKGLDNRRLQHELDRIKRVDMLFYLKGNAREGDNLDALRSFARRNNAKMKERQVGSAMVVVGLNQEEIRHAEWISTLSIEALRHWNTPQIDLSIITANRSPSLSRLLTSLNTADYYDSSVFLTIHLEQTADEETQSIVDRFKWDHGAQGLKRRVVKGGLMAAVMESWYPMGNDSYGVLLEDDVEVSPHFFAWAKLAILHYRYTPSIKSQSSRLYGVSLYQQKVIELLPTGREPFNVHSLFTGLFLPANSPYLSQTPCSWGAVYFPETFREFHSFLKLRLEEESIDLTQHIIAAIRSNRWGRSWKKFFIEFVYLRGYTMLYPNFDDWFSLSTNHFEPGEHNSKPMSQKKKDLVKSQFTLPLLDVDRAGLLSILDLPNRRLPRTWDEVPVLDLWGSVTSEVEIVTRGRLAIEGLRKTCSLESIVGLESTSAMMERPTYNAKELLCPRRAEE